MSRILKPAVAGLAVSSLCLSFIAEIPAQTGTKKKPAVVQTQDQSEAPPPRRNKADSNAGEPAPSPPSANGKGSKLSRPEPQEMRVEAVTPELEKILQDWERNTSQFKKLVGEFTVFKYDKTFEIEKRGEGKFAHEAPDKGNYERKGVEIDKKERSKKKNKDGEPYSLQSDTPERWVCSGKEIIRIDEKEKTYEKIQIPPEAQGQNIIEGPLPFLFGMKAQQAKMRYRMKLLKQTETEIWLQVIPIRRSDASNWDKATVIIDAKRFVPVAVQLFDPTGSEIVHRFKNVEINPRKWIWEGDPFKPNLRGYKEAVVSDQQTSAQPARQAATKPAATKPQAPAEPAKRTASNSEGRNGKSTK